MSTARWPLRALAAATVAVVVALLTVVLVLLLDDEDDHGTPGRSLSPSSAGSATPEDSMTAAATPRPSTAPPLSTPILSPGGPGAATNLVAESACSDVQLRTPLAHLAWNPATNAGVEQRVVMSVTRDGLDRGLYDAGAALPGDASSLVWDDIDPGINHFWWVLTLQAGSWTPSEMSEFLGATCEADLSE